MSRKPVLRGLQKFRGPGSGVMESFGVYHYLAIWKYLAIFYQRPRNTGIKPLTFSLSYYHSYISAIRRMGGNKWNYKSRRVAPGLASREVMGLLTAPPWTLVASNGTISSGFICGEQRLKI